MNGELGATKGAGAGLMRVADWGVLDTAVGGLGRPE